MFSVYPSIGAMFAQVSTLEEAVDLAAGRPGYSVFSASGRCLFENVGGWFRVYGAAGALEGVFWNEADALEFWRRNGADPAWSILGLGDVELDPSAAEGAARFFVVVDREGATVATAADLAGACAVACSSGAVEAGGWIEVWGHDHFIKRLLG